MYLSPPEAIINQVRSLMPVSTMHMMARPLTAQEALIVAERQANLLLRLLNMTKPSVEVELVMELPDIEVEVVPDMPESGTVDWKDDHWLIRINASDSLWRCRATLAHELKHVLDSPYMEVLYPGINPNLYHPPEAEPICEYFGGCFLVPRTWLTRAWANGLHDVADLASLFDVSKNLMTVRLRQTGLLASATNGLGPWPGHQRRGVRRLRSPRLTAKVAMLVSAPGEAKV